MRKDSVQLSFASMLHDIGKLLFRAGMGKADHSSLGSDFIRELWPDERELRLCAAYHHAAALRNARLPENSLAYIVCAADNLSAAADRRESEGGGDSFRRYMPLASIFTHLNGEHPGNWVPPYPQDGRLYMPVKGDASLNAEQYAAAVEALRLRLGDIPVGEEWLDSLLVLLESYCSMFPSSTYAGESPDISLYDHLKTTAAIAGCIGEYLEAQGEHNYRSRLFENETAFRREKAFLLYSADLSGIQRFLYTVASDRALRSLRSRSFFMELAMEHYCDELLAACGMSRVNLLYSGGGHCYLLLPNTEKVKSAIEAWNRRFNCVLSAEFGASLFLAHGYTECSGNELINRPAEEEPYKAMFRRVSAALAKHKLRRYDGSQLRALNRGISDGGRECKICGTGSSLREELCTWCELFGDLSPKIQSNDIYFVSPDGSHPYDFILPAYDGNAYISLTDEKTARSRLGNGEAVSRIYSKNKSCTGLRYSSRIYVGDYAYSNRIEELAQESSGIKRIGVCRMDVDDLGQSFVSGFERKNGTSPQEKQHFVTISRTAAFSRQLSLFFKSCINGILAEKGGGRALAVAVVYSGGDDVFLLGAWQDTLEAALRIRNTLHAFSCGALTISGGVCLVSSHYPVRAAAAMAGELEDRAKAQPGKDSIALFDPDGHFCYSWPSFEESIMNEKLKTLEGFFGSSPDRGSSFLYRLLDLLRAADGSDGRLQLARLAYMLSRLQPSNNHPGYNAYKEFSTKMLEWAADKTERNRLTAAIFIYVYMNRKGEI